jgi:tetratricopeptide (TPR) repeat protein
LFKHIALGALALLLTSSPSWAQNELEQGMVSFYQENYDAAIPLLDKAVRQDPQNTLAMAYLLHSYYKKRDITTIVTRIEQEAVSKGSDPIAQAQLGMAYFLKGLVMPNVMEESLTEFKNAAKDDGKCSLAYTGMGMVYFQKRMMPRAKGYFVRALRINPHDVMALDRLGNILLVDDKKPDEALTLYQRIVDELPTYPDGHYFVGSAMYDLKRYEEAIAPLTRARELDPKGITQGFDAATLVGDCYMKLNRFQEAISAFELAKKIKPDSQYVQVRMEKARTSKPNT